MTTHCTS